jgi:hypothetical protein
MRAGIRKTESPEDVAAAVDKARRAGHKAVLLLVQHSGQRVFVTLEIRSAKD